jgi:multidrug resistance protein, MATE family
MLRWQDMKPEFLPLFRLAIPIALGELGWMSMGLVDTMMLGRFSPDSMAAAGLGGHLFFSVAIFGIGLMLSLDTLVSQAWGAGRTEECHHWLFQALWLALGISPPLMLLAWFMIPAMNRVGLHPDVQKELRPFLEMLIWSMPPLLASAALRRYLQGMGHVRVIMVTLISANLINFAFNYLLIFGKLGFPRMGAAGSALSTVLGRLFILGIYALYAARMRPGAEPRLSWRYARPTLAGIQSVIRIGLPPACQTVMEVGAFAAAAAIIGRLNPLALAAHEVAIGVASYSFMVPMGIGSAGAVRVGNELGAGRPQRAAMAGWAAIVLGIGFMACVGVLFLVAPRAISRLFTNDAAIISAAVPLLAACAPRRERRCRE